MIPLSPSLIVMVAIALGIAALLSTIYLAFGLGGFQLRQNFEAFKPQDRQTIFDRGQQLAFESLVALEFEPLGRYRETLIPFTGAAESFIFLHPTLPAICSLTQHSNEVISVEMVSCSEDGRFLVSATYDPCELSCDERFLYFQCDNQVGVETLFRAHFEALEVWEADAFVPKRVETMEEHAANQRQFWNSIPVRGKRLELGMLAAVGTVLVLVVAPVVIAAAAYFLTAGSGFEISFSQAGSLFASLSLVIALHLIYPMVKSPTGNRGRAPSTKANQPSTGFGRPTSIGFVEYEFQNRHWQNRIGNRWLIHFAALTVFFCYPVLTVMSFAVLFLTGLRRWLAFHSVIAFNDHYITMTKRSFLGSNRQFMKGNSTSQLEFENVLYLDLEETANGTVRLVAGYNDDRPDANVDVLGIRVPIVTYAKDGNTKHTLVDSSWGWTSNELKNCVKNFLPNATAFSQLAVLPRIELLVFGCQVHAIPTRSQLRATACLRQG